VMKSDDDDDDDDSTDSSYYHLVCFGSRNAASLDCPISKN
jgi:hypothetical protein